MKMKRMVRVLEFIGPEDWIDATRRNSWLYAGGHKFNQPSDQMPGHPLLGPHRIARELSCFEEVLDVPGVTEKGVPANEGE